MIGGGRGWTAIRRLRLSAALGCLLHAAPAAALPRSVQELAEPQEREVADTMLAPMLRAGIGEGEAAVMKAMATLDAALARLPRPTRLRGFVQMLRAQGLMSANRPAAARAAADESVRLLPESGSPLLVSAIVAAYSGDSARAADDLLSASRLDPGALGDADAYEIENIIDRLDVDDEEGRLHALAERLLDIGWIGGRVETRSNLAMRAIAGQIGRGDEAAALANVARLIVPRHARLLLIDNRYRALWPEIERRGGIRLEKMWQLYISEAAARFRGDQRPDSRRSYVRARAAANHHDALVAEILPLLSGPLDADRDVDLIEIAPYVARALARRGQWEEADAIFERMLRTWPLGSMANAITLALNRAILVYMRGGAREGAAAIDAVMADARNWGGQVNKSVWGAMHHARACALHLVGEAASAAASRNIAAASESVDDVADLHLCFGDFEAARAALLGGLEEETQRIDVIAYVQPMADVPLPSAWARELADRRRRLAADPLVLAAVARHGRVLPFSLSAGAPPEALPDR